jgi:predicted alpha/beta hydrolase family esterase
VIVPGIWNSDPDHWQSRWQAERAAVDPAGVVRLEPASWGEPDPADWSAAITRAVRSFDEPPVLVAHSLGVLAVADWSGEPDRPSVAGAFLVAPPDPAAPGFPAEASGFAEPLARSSVPTALVVSDDDPYCSVERALGFADTLGARAIRIGPRGHVNVASGVGAWADGRSLLDDFEHSL